MTEEKDDLLLPQKSLFRIDEVAAYFSVSERTIRLWIEHGHLAGEKIVGSIRISRESIMQCRFKK
jgi:excisionase family DNA binding protein